MFITDPGSHAMLTADSTSSRVRGLRAGVLLAAVALTGAAPPAVAAAGDIAQPRSSAMLSPCRPVAVRTVYGGRIARNSHLSPIRNGKVLALNLNTGAKAMVRFGRGSGRWLRSTQGERFAMADQSISQNGRRGGAYVIAAKLGTGRSVPCAGISDCARTPPTPRACR